MASRTDSGVHATGQVAALDADTRLTTGETRNALNYYLPDDLKVHCAATVASDFDPRRSATRRTYEYTLNDAPFPPVINRHVSVHVRNRLNETEMNDACGSLLGARNFSAFAGPSTPPDAVTIRRVDSARVERFGNAVKFTITANAFLHQQIRRLVGSLVDVGLNKVGPQCIQRLLSHPARGAAHRVMPPRGLCLTSIQYDGSEPGRLPTT